LDRRATTTQSTHQTQTMNNALTSLLKVGVCAMLALGAYTRAQAADIAGTYKWTTQGRGGNPGPEMTLKLKLDGDKLTGTVSRPGRQGGNPTETEIKNGKVKGDEISFETVVERGGNTMTTKYSGKVNADGIKGKFERERGGQPQSTDWEAKREKK
jgi:hypothetical protein